MIEQLKKHLMSEGKTDSWLNLAVQFNILPNASNKQRSDKVRKLYNSIDWGKVEIPTVEMKMDYTSNPNWIVDNTYVQDVVYNDGFYNRTTIKNKEWDEFRKWKESKNIQPTTPKPYLNGNPNNVLVVSDIHEPFCKKGYLEFCRLQQEVFNCGTIVFIGDVIDQHFSSFHNIDPDGLGGAMELDQAVNKLKIWHQVFPNAVVTVGNHDKIISRKLYASGVSQRWMKPLHEVLETPTWKYLTEYKHNDIMYVHGEGSTASKKANDELCSVVQGHLHTEGYIQLFNGGKNFAMQVGTGIDFEQYAFAYAQRGKKPILSCGVVMNNIAFLIPFIN